jgi:peroxiredoxin Q/BCP
MSSPAKPKKPTPSKSSGVVAEVGPAVGEMVPHFSMAATIVGSVSPAKFMGKPFIIYFYPKDDTSGCTAEACAFTENAPAFKKIGLTVIGVSKDSLTSHEKFTKKYNLNFPLASDEDGKASEAFGTWVEKSMYGRKYMGIERSTYLVDAEGKIVAVWRKVKVPGHVDEVQKAIKELL